MIIFLGGDTVCNLIIIVNKKFHKMQDIQSMDCLNGSVKGKQNSFHKQKTQNVLHHMNEINHILFVLFFYNRKKVVFWSFKTFMLSFPFTAPAYNIFTFIIMNSVSSLFVSVTCHFVVYAIYTYGMHPL